MSISMLSKHYRKIIIVILMLIFVIPMLAAWLSFSWGWFLSEKKSNYGILLRPPLPISTLALTDDKGNEIKSQLKGKWWLIYITNHPTNSLSKRNLYYLRQIRQATGKNRERIERALITTPPGNNINIWLQKNYPGTNHFTISSEKLKELELNLPKELALQEGSLYLIDPLGNIMLFYAPDAAPKGIFKDLQRVLKVSQIG
jgi:cytochrome oxidase Cu insertion factor (SCO1/SenC/PrrC family)